MIINKNSSRKIFSELTEIVQVIIHLNKKRHYTEDKTEKNKYKLELWRVDISSLWSQIIL